MLARLITQLARGRPAPSRTLQGSDDFLRHLAHGYAAAAQCIQDDNFDHDRFPSGSEQSNQQRIAFFAEATMQSLIGGSEPWCKLYDRLEDDASRNWLVELVLYRLLGSHHVRLRSNNANFHAQVAQAKALGEPISYFKGAFGESKRFTVDGEEGQPISFDGWWLNVAWSFMFRQYYFQRDGVRIAPRPGDCVIDAGACTGDTALAFADSVGNEGQVHAFEVVASNMAVARHNVDLNPHLTGRVTLCDQALGREQGTLYLHGSGPGAMVCDTPGGLPIEVVTLDQYVSNAKLQRVDFIKMDIEGSEEAALLGAEQTIRRWRPRLAISLYHRPEDLVQIPLWLDSLGLGYRLYIDHYTIHMEETVLYATVDPPN